MVVYNAHECGKDAVVFVCRIVVRFGRRFDEGRFVSLKDVLYAYYFHTKNTFLFCSPA